MIKFSEIVGWLGVVLIIAAYFLVSFNVIAANSFSYQLLNLLGAFGILIISVVKKLHQTIITNLFWMAIALLAIVKILL